MTFVRVYIKGENTTLSCTVYWCILLVLFLMDDKNEYTKIRSSCCYV